VSFSEDIEDGEGLLSASGRGSGQWEWGGGTHHSVLRPVWRSTSSVELLPALCDITGGKQVVEDEHEGDVTWDVMGSAGDLKPSVTYQTCMK